MSGEWIGSLHNNARLGDWFFNGFMWQNADRVEVQFIAHFDILAQNSHILQARPAADCWLPADNGRLHPRVWFHLTIGHHCWALKINFWKFSKYSNRSKLCRWILEVRSKMPKNFEVSQGQLTLILTPSSITTPGPRTTFGPIRQPLPILTLGSARTLPSIPSPDRSSAGDYRKRIVNLRIKRNVNRRYEQKLYSRISSTF